jgi:uncharacterized repeat protein (TIGR03803 family)
VFRLHRSLFTGKWTDSVLYHFLPVERNDGNTPYAGVIFGPHGTDLAPNLYGTTANGGDVYQGGTVFQVTPSTGRWTPVKLFGVSENESGGTHPFDPVVFGADGALYGMTDEGGSNDGGVAFKLTPPPRGEGPLWDETVLYNFCYGKIPTPCLGGAFEAGGLVIDVAGALYGTLITGGNTMAVSCSG